MVLSAENVRSSCIWFNWGLSGLTFVFHMWMISRPYSWYFLVLQTTGSSFCAFERSRIISLISNHRKTYDKRKREFGSIKTILVGDTMMKYLTLIFCSSINTHHYYSLLYDEFSSLFQLSHQESPNLRKCLKINESDHAKRSAGHYCCFGCVKHVCVSDLIDVSKGLAVSFSPFCHFSNSSKFDSVDIRVG